MKKVYLIICSIAFAIMILHIGFWLVAGGAGGLNFILGTIFIVGIPLYIWFPVSTVAFIMALKLPAKNEKLKNVLLAIPTLALVLLYSAGEYYGP